MKQKIWKIWIFLNWNSVEAGHRLSQCWENVALKHWYNKTMWIINNFRENTPQREDHWNIIRTTSCLKAFRLLGKFIDEQKNCLLGCCFSENQENLWIFFQYLIVEWSIFFFKCKKSRNLLWAGCMSKNDYIFIEWYLLIVQWVCAATAAEWVSSASVCRSERATGSC